jgi:hypothetical protein
MGTSAQPTLTPTPAPASRRIPTKRPIDLHEALSSTIRAWLASRDTALWTFLSGIDGDTLTEIKLDSSFEMAVDKMNRLRTLALEFAGQIDDRRTAQAVLTDSVEALLTEESPKFLLRVDHLPEAF